MLHGHQQDSMVIGSVATGREEHREEVRPQPSRFTRKSPRLRRDGLRRRAWQHQGCPHPRLHRGDAGFHGKVTRGRRARKYRSTEGSIQFRYHPAAGKFAAVGHTTHAFRPDFARELKVTGSDDRAR